MNETVQFLARHGYVLLIAVVLGRQACLPIPATLVFVAAGALARSGRLSLTAIISCSVLTFLLADLAWYGAGRRRGDRVSMGIPGAVRIDPRALEQYKDVEIAPSREVVLYCESPGEYTSARVALALRRKGIERVHPLAGGLLAWRERGFPVTFEKRAQEGRGVERPPKGLRGVSSLMVARIRALCAKIRVAAGLAR